MAIPAHRGMNLDAESDFGRRTNPLLLLFWVLLQSIAVHHLSSAG